jgi:hypothetical protein
MSEAFEKILNKSLDNRYAYNLINEDELIKLLRVFYEAGRNSMRERWPNDEEIFKASDMSGRGYDPTWMDACDWLKQKLFDTKSSQK